MGSRSVSVLIPEELVGEFYRRVGAWLADDPAASLPADSGTGSAAPGSDAAEWPRRRHSSRYDRLAGLFQDTLDTVTFSFAEIEQRAGLALPASARKHPSWWANTQRTNQARTWLGAGYEVTRFDLSKERVTFERLE